MTHYEARLQRDLDAIRERTRAIGEMVKTALADSLRALRERDHELASRTILGDFPINRAILELDHLCHVFVARHLPAAGVLRYVSSILRVNDLIPDLLAFKLR